MSGDVVGPFQHDGGLPELDYTRANFIIKILTNRKELLLRRRAAEELRISMAHRRYSRDFQKQVVDVFIKVLKKSKEDQIVLEQILWNITNISCENISMLHLMLHKGMVKILAKHAMNEVTAQSVRDQAIWSLSNFAGDCERCRYAVRKTKIADFLLELLQEPQNLTIRQRSVFTWALLNLFRPITGKILEVKDKEKFIDILYSIITLSQPNSSAHDGLTILQEWIAQDTSSHTASLIVTHEPLMSYLLHIFQNEEDLKAIPAVRIVGNIAYSCDALIQKLVDYGFIHELGILLPQAGADLAVAIFWCISNIIGSRKKTYIHEITSQRNIWQLIIQTSYSYDIRIRREALFCALNAVSYLVNEERDQAYREFFGHLIIDTIAGFTNEDSTFLSKTLLAYLTHVVDNLKLRSHLYEPMIFNMKLKEAIELRFQWCQRMMAAGDLTLEGAEYVRNLFNQCLDALDLIENFKALPPPSHPIIESSESVYNDPFELD